MDRPVEKIKNTMNSRVSPWCSLRGPNTWMRMKKTWKARKQRAPKQLCRLVWKTSASWLLRNAKSRRSRRSVRSDKLPRSHDSWRLTTGSETQNVHLSPKSSVGEICKNCVTDRRLFWVTLFYLLTPVLTLIPRMLRGGHRCIMKCMLEVWFDLGFQMEGVEFEFWVRHLYRWNQNYNNNLVNDSFRVI